MSKDTRATGLDDAALDAATGGTMQHDLDNGRLVCEVGVAVSRPGNAAVLFFDEADAVKKTATKVVFEPNDEP